MRSRLLVVGVLAGAIAAVVPFVATTAAVGSNGDPHAVKAYVGYADTLRAPPFTPSPWMGDPRVTFRGTGPDWDAGAIMLRNPSHNPLTVDDVNVEIGVTTYDLWAPYPIVVPGKGTLILTQTAFFDFDTSDVPGNDVTVPCDTPSTDIPAVHVTVGARHPKTKTFFDNTQVLNTGGVDPVTCTPGANEGHAWKRVKRGHGTH